MTSPTILLRPLSSYTFTTKAAQPEEDPSVSARLQRLRNQYEDFGMRRTVESVLIVHEHGHPHILMIQIASAFFKLPGDYLRPGEDEIQGLSDRLDEKLMPTDEAPESFGPAGEGREQKMGEWEIGDCLATWWRPGFETFMVRQQYAHNIITCRRLLELYQADAILYSWLSTVSLRSTAHHQAQGVQKDVHGPNAAKQ